jgi:hypothetical protein
MQTLLDADEQSDIPSLQTSFAPVGVTIEPAGFRDRLRKMRSLPLHRGPIMKSYNQFKVSDVI